MKAFAHTQWQPGPTEHAFQSAGQIAVADPPQIPLFAKSQAHSVSDHRLAPPTRLPLSGGKTQKHVSDYTATSNGC
jgi:hypothetical protein